MSLAQNQLTVAGRTMVLGDAIKVMHDRLKPCAQDECAARLTTGRYKADYAGQITFGMQLQHRMVPLSPSALFFRGATSPLSNVMRQLPQIPARQE